MPCRDYEGMTDADRAIEKAGKEHDLVVKPLREKIDKLTDMLCWVLTNNRFGNLRDDIREWWTHHQKNDEKIKKQKRITALAKLTDEEKELLGVKF